MLKPSDLKIVTDNVLVLDLSLDVPDLTAPRLILDEAEKQRADRFFNDVHRRRFTVAHAALRLALAHASGRQPESLIFHHNAYGKPRLANSSPDIRFNLSHAEGRALIALAHGREVGIDIEYKRLIEPLELAYLCFSSRECIALQRLSAPERFHAFFRGWTRKESFIKANGRGFSYPLNSFEVSLDKSPQNALLVDSSEDNALKRRWRTLSIEVGGPFAAALTVEGTDWRLLKHKTSLPELQELFSFHTSIQQCECRASDRPPPLR